MIAVAAIIRTVTRASAVLGAGVPGSFSVMALAAAGLAAAGLGAAGMVPFSVTPVMAQTSGPAAGQAASRSDTEFVAGLSDVPVMPGLSSGGEQPLVFDKPGARIVETVLTGRVDQRAVLSFYNQTLPQLGWAVADGRTRSAGSEARFQREGEELSVDVRGALGRTTVHFRLSPQ